MDFKVSLEDHVAICAIADRAVAMARRFGSRIEKIEFVMSLSAVHNKRPLRLHELLGTDDANFSHDVFGIYNCLDTETGELRNCFVPRFTRKPDACDNGGCHYTV